MLGEKIGTMKFTSENAAIESGSYGMPAMETKASGSGMLAGCEVMAQSTFTAEMRPDGSWLGECPNSGIIMCPEGVATFRANGLGNFTEDGGVKFRGSCMFETTSEALASLNGKAHMFTWDVDSEGNATWEVYPCN